MLFCFGNFAKSLSAYINQGLERFWQNYENCYIYGACEFSVVYYSISAYMFLEFALSSIISVMRFSRFLRVISVLYLLAKAFCLVDSDSMPNMVKPASITAPKIVMLI